MNFLLCGGWHLNSLVVQGPTVFKILCSQKLRIRGRWATTKLRSPKSQGICSYFSSVPDDPRRHARKGKPGLLHRPVTDVTKAT